MLPEKKSPDRRNLLMWIGAILAGLPLLRWLLPKENRIETVKMLTRDGRLVEVDKRSLPQKKIKIDDKELLSWVKRN